MEKTVNKTHKDLQDLYAILEMEIPKRFQVTYLIAKQKLIVLFC